VLPRLVDLVDQGIVRILDLAFLRKGLSRSKSSAKASLTT
jgi:hypothetical protein